MNGLYYVYKCIVIYNSALEIYIGNWYISINFIEKALPLMELGVGTTKQKSSILNKLGIGKNNTNCNCHRLNWALVHFNTNDLKLSGAYITNAD